MILKDLRSKGPTPNGVLQELEDPEARYCAGLQNFEKFVACPNYRSALLQVSGVPTPHPSREVSSGRAPPPSNYYD